MLTHRIALRAGAVIALLVAPAFAAPTPTISELAPPNSVVVIGVDDCGAMLGAFDKTGFATIWKDAKFQAWFKEHSKEAMEGFSKELDSLGVKTEDLQRPSGPVGLAAWFPSDPAAQESAATAPPSVLIVADYADKAADMDQTLVTLLEKGQQQKRLELVESEHAGVTIYAYNFIKSDKDADQDRVEVEDPLDEDMGMGPDGPGAMLDYKVMHYARVESALIICSEKQALERTIDRLKGDAAPSISESPAFQQARSQVGAAQGYAVVLGDAGRTWLKQQNAAAAEAGDPFASIIESALGTLGLANIQSFSAGFRFDADDGMLEANWAALTPSKEGLVALLDAPEAPFDPPAFVPASAVDVTLFQMNFGGLLPLAERVVKGLPEDYRGMAEGQVMGIQQTMGPMLAGIGPEVYIISTLERPLSPQSQRQVFAIKVRNPEPLVATLTRLAPAFGMSPRDFNGNQIFTPDAGGRIPPDAASIGLGFGHVFVGPTAAVENLMRDAGAAEAPRLSAEKRFKDAIRATAGKGIGYSYADTAQRLDWLEWYMTNIEKVVEAQTKAMFGPDEPADADERQWREELAKMRREAIPSWMRNPPPLDTIRATVGDMISEYRATPQGFVGRTLILPKR